MQPIEIPEFPVLRDEEAIWALFDFMHELEEERGKELTEKQTNALVKITKGLISSVEAEMRSGTSDGDVREPRFVGQQLKNSYQMHSGMRVTLF